MFKLLRLMSTVLNLKLSRHVHEAVMHEAVMHEAARPDRVCAHGLQERLRALGHPLHRGPAAPTRRPAHSSGGFSDHGNEKGGKPRAPAIFDHMPALA